VAATVFHVALATESDAVIEGAIVTDDCGFADDNASSVVDEQAIADSGTGVDFDERPPPNDL
jgi:hypothetical protein